MSESARVHEEHDRRLSRIEHEVNHLGDKLGDIERDMGGMRRDLETLAATALWIKSKSKWAALVLVVLQSVIAAKATQHVAATGTQTSDRVVTK